MLEEKTKHLMVNMQALQPLIISNALNVLGAIVILLIGLWLSGRADRMENALDPANGNPIDPRMPYLAKAPRGQRATAESHASAARSRPDFWPHRPVAAKAGLFAAQRLAHRLVGWRDVRN